MINLSNFDSPVFENYDINLVQKEVDGGMISREQIDGIREFAGAESIVISGLNQENFDYFVNTYGKQFKAINFWKNKTVSDLSALSGLTDIEYISLFYNQKADRLWDMTDNKKLVALSLSDFNRLHSLAGIEKAGNLKTFYIYDRVYARMEIDSLMPISNTDIRHFMWGGRRVRDNDYACLAHGKIEELDIAPTQFTMEELARLLACFPETLKGTSTKPYTRGGVMDKDGFREIFSLCKGKKSCVRGRDDERFERYMREFEGMLSEYRKNICTILS